MELEFRVLVNPTYAGPVEGAVAFETGATIADVADPEKLTYEHHGPEFSPRAPGALTRFYEDLILGHPMPLTFVTRRVNDIDTVMAAALFMRRDIAIHPSAPSLVATIDLVHRHGLTCLGHVERDLGRFLRLLRAYLPPSLGKEEAGTRLATAIDWITEYVKTGNLPHLGSPWPDVRVLDRGTDGFVLAESHGPLLDGWVELYRQGFLRGLLVGPMNEEGKRRVIISKKSDYLRFDLTKAADILNGMESAMGELPGWRIEGPLWLFGPEEGTGILLRHLLDVLVRV